MENKRNWDKFEPLYFFLPERVGYVNMEGD